MTLITVNTADPAGYDGRASLKTYPRQTVLSQWGYAHRLQVRSRWVITTSGLSFHLSKRSGVVIP